MINGGIFGPKLSGKTTLAKQLCVNLWREERRPALILDPHFEDWPKGHTFLAPKKFNEQGEPFADEQLFWRGVWKERRCLIIVEEAAATIRRERELVPVFTRLRHCDHKLLVIGHNGTDLLPVMRQQLDVVYLFRQPESAAKIWAENFARKEALQSTELGQFEFLRVESYNPPKKFKLPKP